MGVATLASTIVTGVGMAALFYSLLQAQRAKPACVWVWANADQSGAKACLPAGTTSVAFTPQYVICPRGLSLKMEFANTDSSVSNISVGSNSIAKLGNVVSAGQTMKSISVTAS